MEKIKIGKIVNAVALRGEVKVYHYSDYKERFEELEEILVERNAAKKHTMESYEIEGVRYQKDMAILKLKGVNDRNAAEALKDCDVYITEADLRELPEDTFYIRDLMGCRVINRSENTENEEEIGIITDVLQNTAQDIYQVKTKAGKEVLIPAVGEFVKEINIDEKTVIVSLIPGFMDGALEA
ncbi:MAG: ribosome maturation factor RimM [Anaerovoracaceae bacterium]